MVSMFLCVTTGRFHGKIHICVILQCALYHVSLILANKSSTFPLKMCQHWAQSIKLLSSHKSWKNELSHHALLSLHHHFNPSVLLFFYPPSPFLLKSASSLHSIRNSTKAIPHLENPSHGSLDHCLQSALIERIVSLMWHPVRCHVEMRTDSGRWTVLVGKMWFIFFSKCYSTEDNPSSLNKNDKALLPVIWHYHCKLHGPCFLFHTSLDDSFSSASSFCLNQSMSMWEKQKHFHMCTMFK